MPPYSCLITISLPPLITEKKQSTRAGRLSSSSTSSSVRNIVLGLAKGVDKRLARRRARIRSSWSLFVCWPTSVCHHKSLRRQPVRVHARCTVISSTVVVMAAPPPYAVDWVPSSSVSAPASSRRGEHTPSRSPQTPLAGNRPSCHKEDTQQDIARVHTHTFPGLPAHYSFNGLRRSFWPVVAILDLAVDRAVLRHCRMSPLLSLMFHTYYYFISSIVCYRPSRSFFLVSVQCARQRSPSIDQRVAGPS
ncbi:hypothetical protein BCV69DRAFT_99896 [Microstroma glucosiphilum]|uniref:Uncharacterized protein n=1 Tax=Pseudomicrostroma glucosiphilum TaxID=1684307 RepID=A0A316UI57_9BASI|nr:hypothetical protein BCV69DRAFT_99896 [Pseudomicrostroma glucosiphilum]PWN22875.1 hypothetical protein BCV69DRAFT_99896 [Pseudomicrostroma glucosiphilum]